MTTLGNVPPHISTLFWKLWFSVGSNTGTRPRLHTYNVYDNDLSEVNETPSPPSESFSVFKEFNLDDSGSNTIPIPADSTISRVLRQAEDVFLHLEVDVLAILEDIIRQLNGRLTSSTSKADGSGPFLQCKPGSSLNSLCIPHQNLAKLSRFLIFLRFRNSAGYTYLIRDLQTTIEQRSRDGQVFPAYSHFIVQMKRKYLLNAFLDFLVGGERRSSRGYDEPGSRTAATDSFINQTLEIMDIYCWRLIDAEVCVGVAQEDQEYILPDCCYGALDEGFAEDPENDAFFFPISPSISIYLLGNSRVSSPPSPIMDNFMTSISVGHESVIDVHLRNSLVLQTYPSKLIFSSLRSVALSIASYDEFRWTNEHQDYSRLRMRCRQKFLVEGVVKTLVLRGSIGTSGGDDVDETSGVAGDAEVRVLDLTDQVRLQGNWAVAFGTFSDVWRGVWDDPVEKRERAVAVKFLRQVMVQNVKERLIRRIQAEVATWHKFCHRNVSQFFGIVQSSNSIGMVSPWYSNGPICEFVKVHASTDRLRLLIQVASGVAHLHSFNPPIVHGDLKGGNILVDAQGSAIIADFGLSKVMEEVANACSEEDRPVRGRGTSIFAGSTRWMAPELIMALVNDDETGAGGPKITTMSDVYAFGSVCLEIATNQLPYPHRTNDHAVTLDIIRGILPQRAKVCLVKVADEETFWQLLERCWSISQLRPSMEEVMKSLEGMAVTQRLAPSPYGLEMSPLHHRRRGW